jgi:DNA-binding MarR family transcriptional regulator
LRAEPSRQLDTSILFDVFALDQAVGRLLTTAMRESPLTPADYAVSSAIFELEAASPTELAARLGMRLTTCMDQLRRFEARGLARRLPHPTDGRSYRIVLTRAGTEAQRLANRSFEGAYQAFVAGLPAGGRGARRSLRSLRGAADAALARLEAGPPFTEARPARRRRAALSRPLQVDRAG